MNNHDLTYTNSNSRSGQNLRRLAAASHARSEFPSALHIRHGIVLPSRTGNGLPLLGLGGVVRSDGTFVDESAHNREGVRVFGGAYDPEAPYKTSSESVVYLGPISWHWGNFLLDYIARMWYLLDRPIPERIVYCGSHLDPGSFGSNHAKFLEVFSLLDVPAERLLDVRVPTAFQSVTVPEPAYEPGGSLTPMYRRIYERISANVEDRLPREATHSCARRIYFTRTRLDHRKEVGEEAIENLFARNGYEIVAPESHSVASQVSMVRSCAVMVSLEGTVAHNVIFAKSSTSQVILRKQSWLNPRQVVINQAVGNSVVYIDAFMEPLRRYPRSHDDGPFWVRVGGELRRFALDQRMLAHTRVHYMALDCINLVIYLGMCAVVEGRGFIRRFRAQLRRNLPDSVVTRIRARSSLARRDARRFPRIRA